MGRKTKTRQQHHNQQPPQNSVQQPPQNNGQQPAQYYVQQPAHNYYVQQQPQLNHVQQQIQYSQQLPVPQDTYPQLNSEEYPEQPIEKKYQMFHGITEVDIPVLAAEAANFLQDLSWRFIYQIGTLQTIHSMRIERQEYKTVLKIAFIRGQLEFYFRHPNFHMRQLQLASAGGFVSISDIMQFPRMKTLHGSQDEIKQAIADSPILELSPTEQEMRITHPQWIFPGGNVFFNPHGSVFPSMNASRSVPAANQFETSICFGVEFDHINSFIHYHVENRIRKGMWVMKLVFNLDSNTGTVTGWWEMLYF